MFDVLTRETNNNNRNKTFWDRPKQRQSDLNTKSLKRHQFGKIENRICDKEIKALTLSFVSPNVIKSNIHKHRASVASAAPTLPSPLPPITHNMHKKNMCKLIFKKWKWMGVELCLNGRVYWTTTATTTTTTTTTNVCWNTIVCIADCGISQSRCARKKCHFS